MVRRKLFDYFHFKVEFFATKDGGEIELPKLSREAQRRPALIEIDEELDAQGAPEICETDVSCQRLELC